MIDATSFWLTPLILLPGVALFAVASLLGMMAALWESESSVWIVLGIAAAGIVCLAFASFELIRESLYALDIISEHEHQIDKSGTGPAVND